MVGNFCNRTACRIRNRRRRHDNNMTLRKKKPPRASQHYMGWRTGQKSLLLPVAGEFFLLTLPFIERANRKLTHHLSNARVDTLAGVRYAFEFTQLELSHLRGTDKPPHGRRKAPHPRTGFFRVVQPTGP